jgi:antitoxin (DNA-binding transcriptional repressor) of toxin-antitoxin stability system
VAPTVDGRRQRWCPAPSRRAVAPQSLVEIAPARLHVLGPGKVPLAPRSRTGLEGAEPVAGGLLAERVVIRHVRVRSTMCYSDVVADEITQRQLRNDSGEIMRGLDRGQTFVVTRNGVPVGELTPMRRHRFVSTDAVLAMFENAPSIEFEQLRTDLDYVASQTAEPRG